MNSITLNTVIVLPQKIDVYIIYISESVVTEKYRFLCNFIASACSCSCSGSLEGLRILYMLAII